VTPVNTTDNGVNISDNGENVLDVPCLTQAECMEKTQHLLGEFKKTMKMLVNLENFKYKIEKGYYITPFLAYK